MYLGDYTEDYATLNFKFTTRKFSTGAPFALADGVISVYKANSTTQTTVGVTLSADFDGVTGLNNVLIDLSADAFYAVATDYAVVITTGTVDSVSVVGETIAHFSIENRFKEVDVTKWLGTAVTLSTGNKPDVNVDEWHDVLLATTNPLPNAVAGAANGLTIAGTNAAASFATLDVVGLLSAGSVSIDSTMDVVGALTAGSVSIDGTMDVVGAFSVNSFLVDTTTTYTGAVLYSSTETHTGNIVQNGDAPMEVDMIYYKGVAADDPITMTDITSDGSAIAVTAGVVDHVTLVDTTTTVTDATVDSSGVTELLTRVPDATAGEAGGLLIAGSNAATTFATLTSTGALTVSDGIVVTCSTDSKSALKLTGGATAGKGLEVIGTGTGNAVTLTGAVSCSSTFDVVGALSANSLLIDTTTTLTGAVSLPTSLAIETFDIADTFTIGGACLITGTTTLTGNVSCGAGFDVVGALSANSLLIDTTTTLTGNVSCAAAFDVVGALTAGSVSIDATMDVVGALTCASFATDGTFVVGTNYSVGGTTTHTGITTHTGAVTLTNGINTGTITGTLPAIPNNWITAAGIANAAIDAATFAADVDAEFASYVWDALAASYDTASTMGNQLNNVEVDSETVADAVLARAVSNVEDTADKHSLAALVMLGTNSAVSTDGTAITAKKPSDDTTFETYTITSDDDAYPITGIS